MTCSCIRGNKFSIDIRHLSCSEIIITDHSEWMTEEYYIVPESYKINIHIPGGAIKVVEIATQGSTKLSAHDLLSNNCFIDGIYCFSVDNCGDNITINKALLCTTECRLANLIRDASKDHDNRLWNNAIKFKSQIDAIKFHSEINNFNMANTEFSILKKELDKLNCNC